MESFGWKKVTIDCEDAFPEEDGVSFLPNAGKSIPMGFLDQIRISQEEKYEGGDRFLPPRGTRLYVREEMVHTFTQLIDKRRKFCQVLIGSPGVGKSILLFLVALYRASVEQQKVLYIRKTKDSHEFVSAFYIRPVVDDDEEEGGGGGGVNDAVGSTAAAAAKATKTTTSSTTKKRMVQIDFARNIKKSTTLENLEIYLAKTYFHSKSSSNDDDNNNIAIPKKKQKTKTTKEDGTVIYSNHNDQKLLKNVLLFLDGFHVEELQNDIYHYLAQY